jgi:hypothetical protein
MINYICFDLKGSFGLLVFSATTHLGAALTLCVTPVALLFKITGVLIILVSFIHNLGWHALRVAPSALRRVWLVSNQEWMWMDGRGKRVSGYLMGDSIVTTVLIILNFRIGQYGRRSVVLCGDMLTSEEFRRLRLYLLANRKEKRESIG